VPKTFVGQGRMRFVDPKGGTEPIGKRIITVPEDADARAAAIRIQVSSPTCRRKHRQGRALARGGAKTIACHDCHGDGLNGLANVPKIAGLHPIYIARQLMHFKEGSRNGADSPLMKKTVAQARRRRHHQPRGIRGFRSALMQGPT
jgi:cytochrome c553